VSRFAFYIKYCVPDDLQNFTLE